MRHRCDPPAAELAQALRLRRSGRVHAGACPACTYKGVFTVEDGDDRTLVKCHAGCPQEDVIGSLRQLGLWPGDAGHDQPVRRERPQKADASRFAAELWRRSVPAAGTVVEGYLRARGIALPVPPTLRYLPDAKHGPTGLLFPAMLAAVTVWPGRAVGAVHRTFLRPDGAGKAAVSTPKMSLGPIGGGAVRLAPAGPHLVVGEGIETTLSAMQAGGLPGWAALSAGGIRELILPPLPLAATVTVAADRDDGGVGLEAAREAAGRWTWEGRTVRIALPPEGTDFNDLINGDAA